MRPGGTVGTIHVMSERLESALIALACLFVIFTFAAFLAFLADAMLIARQVGETGDTLSGWSGSVVQAGATIIAGLLALIAGAFAYFGIRLQIRQQAVRDAENRLMRAKATAVEAHYAVDRCQQLARHAVAVIIPTLRQKVGRDHASDWAVPFPNICEWPIATVETLGLPICLARARVTSCYQRLRTIYETARRLNQNTQTRHTHTVALTREITASYDLLEHACSILVEGLEKARVAKTIHDLDDMDILTD